MGRREEEQIPGSGSSRFPVLLPTSGTSGRESSAKGVPRGRGESVSTARRINEDGLVHGLPRAPGFHRLRHLSQMIRGADSEWIGASSERWARRGDGGSRARRLRSGIVRHHPVLVPEEPFVPGESPG
jgi:hypothetical protein